MTYHIMPKDLLIRYCTPYSQWSERHIATCHYIDLPDGTVLVKAAFTHENRQAEAERHPDVLSLPHPMSGECVCSKTVAKLAHLGVKATHRTWDVAAIAAKIHPQMRLG